MLKFFKSKSVINLLVRGGSLSLKFFFIFFLGKVSIDTVNLGIYGIFEGSIRLLLYLAGFDYYNYTNRKLAISKDKLAYFIKNQFVFHSLFYVFILPFFIWQVFLWDFLSLEYVYVFCIILIFEHLNQELFRILSILKKPIEANICLLIKSLWIPLVVVFYIYTKEVNLLIYFMFWGLFGLLSFIISLIYLGKIVPIKKILSSAFHFSEIRNGLKVAVIFFISSISFKIIQLGDRFIVDHFYGKKISGVYSTYVGVSGTLEILTLNLVTIIYLPHLIESYSGNGTESYDLIKKKFNQRIFLVSFFGALAIAITAYPIFSFLEKDLLLTEINTFYILVIGSFLFNISTIPNILLYVKNKDKLILISSIFPAILNVILNLILIPKYDIMGASISACTSYFALLALKWYFMKRNSLKSA